MGETVEHAEAATAAQADGTFVLGLTMAGAISGGTYTAGVLSFLAEALDSWDADRGQPGVDRHRVVLKAISGASAGSICGALGAISLAEPPGEAEMAERRSGGKIAVPRRLPRLFDAWVEGPRLVAPSGESGDLLGAEDLNDGALASLLDSTRLDAVAAAGVAPMAEVRPRRPWLDPRLHLFMTHTDMRGVPYRVSFRGAAADGDHSADHGMLAHADRVHYILQLGPAAGAAPEPVEDNPWLKEDGSAVTLDLPQLLRETQTPPELAELAQSTLASSAFPLGFKARVLRHEWKRWAKRPMPVPVTTADGTSRWLVLKASPDSTSPFGVDPARTPVWDGGCLDNEPFQLARWAIMQAPPKPNPPHGSMADRAVIMIDPFPEPPAMPGWAPDAEVLGILPLLGRAPGVFINSSRFKPEEIAAALDERVFSRFLIAPRRIWEKGQPTEAKLAGAKALASGGLGGFGGTIARSFRLYDFQLGRRNCRSFLRDHFALHERNKAVWLSAEPEAAGERPLIPLRGAAKDPIELPDWPRISHGELEEIIARIAGRADAVVGQPVGRLPRASLRLLARLAWTTWGRNRLIEHARWTLFRDLLARDQITGWKDGAEGLEDIGDTERRLLWLLADPGWAGRSEAALRARLDGVQLLHPRGRRVVDAAEALARLERLGWVVRMANPPDAWRLRVRAPGFLGQLRNLVFGAQGVETAPSTH